MTTKSQHTPGQIRVGDHPGNGAGTKWRSLLADGEFGPMYLGEALQDDAARLALCWNSHDNLVAALAELRRELRDAGLKLNVRTHFSLMAADAQAGTVLHKIGVTQ